MNLRFLNDDIIVRQSGGPVACTAADPDDVASGEDVPILAPVTVVEIAIAISISIIRVAVPVVRFAIPLPVVGFSVGVFISVPGLSRRVRRLQGRLGPGMRR